MESHNLQAENSKQRGSIIIYTLLILSTVILISITMIRLFVPKFRIVNEATHSVVALYAADSGMELCLFTNRNDTSLMSIPPTLSTLLANYTILGVSIQSYPNPCVYNGTTDPRVVGNYRGVSRSLEADI